MKKIGLIFSLLLLMVSAVFGAYVEIGDGVETTIYAPVNGWYNYSWSNYILTADQISTAGTIDEIQFNVGNTPDNYQTDNQQIYLKLTTASEVTITYPDPVNNGFTLVYNGAVTWNGSGWQGIILDTEFSYDGTSNLQIVWENHDSSWSYGYPKFLITDTEEYRTAYKYFDGSFPAVSGEVVQYYPNTRLGFSPVTPTAPTLVAPANYSFYVNLHPNLEWINGANTEFIKVYLSTEKAEVINNSGNALVLDGGLATTYSPSLEFASTYYWKVVASNSTSINTAETPVYKFTTAMPENSIQIGGGDTVNEGLPIEPYYGYSYSQTIYPQAEINSAGYIETIAWDYNGNSAWSDDAIKIYMGHTTETTFASNTSWINVAELTLVYDGSLSVPATNGWVTITLDTPFSYNNVSNLVIAVDENTSGCHGYNDEFYCTTATGNVSIRYISDSTNPDPASPPSGTRKAYYPNTRLEFSPTAPTLVAPANYSFNVNLHPNLEWINGDNTEFLKVYLSTEEAEVVNNSENALVLDGGLTTTYSPSLEFASTYYWKVMASNSTSINTAQTPVYKFTTVPSEYSIQIGGGDTVNEGLPIEPYYGYSYSQTIYPQTAVNKQVDISTVAWDYTGSHAWSDDAIKIYMGHTTETTFASNTSWINVAELTLVYDGTLSVPATRGWIPITLDTPFSYNNVSNLVIAVEENTSGYHGSNDDFYCTGATGNVSITHRSDSTNPDPASPPDGTRKAFYPNTRLGFSPTAPTIVAPANYSFNIDSDTSLEWINGANTEFIKVYFSTEKAAVINNSGNALVLDGGLATTYSPSLEPASTYYWKVVASNYISINVAETPIYKFTTVPPAGSIHFGGGDNVHQGLPIDPFFNSTYSQTIYPQTDVNKQGDINSLAWSYNGNSAWGPDNLKIYMGHTTETTFASRTSWFNVEDLTLVYDGSITVSAIEGWVPITLDTPFFYNNQDNLVIAAFEYTYGHHGYNDAFYSTETTGNVSIICSTNATGLNPASPPIGYLKVFYPNLLLAMTNKITISGQITSSVADAGIPATVTLSGTENYSTTADAFGNYIISSIVTNSDYVLNVAYLGYVGYSSEISAGESNIELDVVLGDLATPNNFVVEVNQGVVNLSWDAVSNSDRAFLGYNLYRNGILLNSEPLTTNSYADYDIVHGETYSYYQTNILDEGESTASNAVEVLAVNYAGAGTEAQPYLINDLTDLRILSEYQFLWNSAYHFEQTANIEASSTLTLNEGAGFSPIGNSTTNFTGSYNGNGNTISNLYINRASQNYIGLFGYTNNATISNVGLVNNHITGNQSYTGGLVGYSDSSTISNIYATGDVSGYFFVGGLVGYSTYSSTITNSYATGSVSGNLNENMYIGGLVGYSDYSTISNSYTTGSVSGSDCVGGLVGHLVDSTISNSYATGAVSGTSSNVGGLVGYSDNSSVNNSFWNTETTGQQASAGGTGKTTAAMQTLSTYIDAGWDFVDETTNGTADIWTFVANDYPHLTGEGYNHQLTAPPVDLIASVETGSINLTWSAPVLQTRALVSYNVYRDDVKINEDVMDTEFIDTDLMHNQTYNYHVTALYDEGESAASNLVEATAILDVSLTGQGTADNPFKITSIADLIYLSNYSGIWNSYFSQTANIEASSTANLNDEAGFNPIGNDIINFTGSYNGNGNTISNLSIISSSSFYIGLFGGIYEANISNIGLINNQITGNNQATGGLVGLSEDSTISNSYTTGDVSSFGNNVGGLVGESSGCIISNSYTTGSVSGNQDVGGLVGLSYDSTISNSYTTGSVSGDDFVGGLVGFLQSSTISNSYATSSASVTYSCLGGLVGNSFFSTISNSYATGSLSGNVRVGGLVGLGLQNTTTSVTNSFWDIETTGQTESDGGTGKTTAEMKTFATYTDWDFVGETINGTQYIWTYYDNHYPHLTWEMFLVPDFTVSQETIYVDESIEFTSLSQGPIVEYLWNFGDGGTSTEESPIHTYTQAGVYSVTLTISNANNTQAITKTDYITVNNYPDISVTPSEINVTLTVGDSETQDLIVTNNGQGWLNGSLSVGDNIMRSGTPEIIYGQARSSESTASGLRVSGNLVPSAKNITANRSGSYSVLYIAAIDEDEDAIFTEAMNELDNVSEFTRLSAEYDTPNVAYMLEYDVVIVASIYLFNNPTLLGDNLASYSDAGGKLIVLPATFYTEWGLGGVIAGSDYMPLAVTDYSNDYTSGNSFISHPITQGVSEISVIQYAYTHAQGDGIVLGSFASGSPIVAYNPNKPIIAINVCPPDGWWGGDFIQLISNSINWLTNIEWLTLSETELSIAPGASQVIAVTLNSEELEVGVYTKLIKISSNDPDEPMLNIPVTMNVLEVLVPDFVASEATIDLSESIQFTNLSTGTIDNYLWDFGDENTSAEENPLHIYTEPGVYSVTLTISNAAGSEVITKTDYITVIGFPNISVDLSEVNATLTVGDSETQSLIVTNNGEGWLNGSLSVGNSIMRSGTPEIMFGQARSGESTTSGLRASGNLVPSAKNDTSTRSGSYSVLYIAAIPEYEDAIFTAAMNELNNVSEFARLNAVYETPNVAYMLQYDVVIVASESMFSNPSLLGDNLASYCDAGGKLILLPATFYTEWGLGGVIAGSDYLPLALTDYSSDYTSGTSFISHPITQGVFEISVTQYAYTHAQGDGVVLGSYSDGSPIVAYNPNKDIVAINVCPPDGWWGGDFIQLVSNSINWLCDTYDWLTLSETVLSIAPGASTTITVTLNSEELEAGIHLAGIQISSNDPDEPLLNIPVTMNVLEVLVPDFVASETTINLTESIQFTNLSTGSIDEYLWNFGDTNTSIEENPIHTYTEPGVYSVTLTITNTISNDSLTKIDYITVIGFPDISVNPQEVNVTLAAGDSETQNLIISNMGQGVLDASLSIGANIMRSNQPGVISGQARNTKSITSSRSDGYSVLFISTLEEFEHSTFRIEVSNLSNISLFTSFNARYETPNVDYMLQYDVVIISSNWPFANSIQLGDNLASYSDVGGKIIVLGSAFYEIGLEGAIVNPEYLPLAVASYEVSTFIGTDFVSHPITADVSEISTAVCANTYTQGDGISLGSYPNGYPIAAYNPHKPIVVINAYPSNGNWGGDLVQMVSNSINWLNETFVWVSLSESTLSIAPGASESVAVNLNAEYLKRGVYSKMINISSNDPEEPIISIPVTMSLIEALVAKFVASATTITLGTSSEFTNQSAGIIDNYLWEFGDGNTSTEENPIHTYTQAGLYSVSLTISGSNGDDSITKTDYITVNSAPNIAVNPAEFDVTLTTGETATQSLIVTNNGEGWLNGSLRVVATTMRSGTPEIIYGQARSSESISSGSRPSKNLIPSAKNITSSRSGSYSVLYVNAMDQMDTAFRTAMNELSNVSSFDEFDARTGTPNVAYMLQYDLIIVSSDYTFTNPTLLGNNLASYCDAGGKLIALACTFFTGNDWSLSGAIAGSDYLPLAVTDYSNEGATGTEFISHPITQDVSQISTTIYAMTHLQGDGVSLGSYPNGYPIAAYNPHKPIVAINVYPQDNQWGGDFIQLISNTINWLGEATSWISLSDNNLSIAPGGSGTIEVTLNSEELELGVYTAAINILSNDPNEPMISIPVTMNVVDISADFVASETTVNSGVSVEFTNLSVGTITTYLWEFGDGNTSAEENPSHTYSQAGIYSVSLTITGANGGDSITKTDYITVNPAPNISVNPQEINTTLILGESEIQLFTISNTGEGNLNYNISTTSTTSGNRDFETRTSYDSPTTLNSANNNSLTKLQHKHDFSKQVYKNRARTGGSENILYFEENSDYEHYNSALDNLGYARTFVYDIDLFYSELTNGTEWDLVIFNSYYTESETYIRNQINSYLVNGGKLIYCDHDVSYYSSSILLATMGVQFVDNCEDAYSFSATIPQHSVFTSPNSISELIPTDDSYYDEAQIVNAKNGATQLAAFAGYPDSGAIVINSSQTSIFNAFYAENYNSDNDNDGKIDMVELLENQIKYLMPCNWLSISTVTGSIAPHTTETIEVTLNSEELELGVYTAAINILSNDPDEPMISIPVTMNVVDISADFVASETTVNSGTSVEFTNLSVGTITTYLWEFGDGNTSAEENPSHTYSQAGLYSVTLTITGANGGDSITKSDYITVLQEEEGDLLAPQNLAIAIINGVVHLTWDEVTDPVTGASVGNMLYTIYSSTEPSGTYQPLDTVTELTWSDVNNPDGARRFYCVVAHTGAITASSEGFINTHRKITRDGKVIKSKK